MKREDLQIYRKLIKTKIFYESGCGAKICKSGNNWFECDNCYIWFHRNCKNMKKINKKFYCSCCTKEK